MDHTGDRVGQFLFCPVLRTSFAAAIVQPLAVATRGGLGLDASAGAQALGTLALFSALMASEPLALHSSP